MIYVEPVEEFSALVLGVLCCKSECRMSWNKNNLIIMIKRFSL